MANIIQQIRETFPLTISEEELCAKTCSYGCPKKLLEFIDTEITDWEQRLANGETPTLSDIDKMSRTGKKIYAVLEKNKLINCEAIRQ